MQIETREKVREAIARIAFIEPSEVRDDAHLTEDLQFDSLDTADLALAIEQLLENHTGNVHYIPERESARWNTVADVMASAEHPTPKTQPTT